MSKYEVAWTATALRDFDDLPEKVAFAILEFCTSTLTQDALRVSKSLRAPFEGMRSSRRGQYRIIFSLDSDENTVFIRSVRHRNVAYFKR